MILSATEMSCLPTTHVTDISTCLSPQAHHRQIWAPSHHCHQYLHLHWRTQRHCLLLYKKPGMSKMTYWPSQSINQPGIFSLSTKSGSNASLFKPVHMVAYSGKELPILRRKRSSDWHLKQPQLWLVSVVLQLVSTVLCSFQCVACWFCCVVLILLCCGLFPLCCALLGHRSISFNNTKSKMLQNHILWESVSCYTAKHALFLESVLKNL